MSTTRSSDETTKLLYTAKAHTREVRCGPLMAGWMSSFPFLAAPGHGTNPEQLFAVGWSACFLSAIKHTASQMKVNLPAEVAIDPEVELRSGSDGYFLKARLNVSLPGLERQVAQSIVDLAHQACPYSKATRGNIDVAINLVETGNAEPSGKRAP